MAEVRVCPKCKSTDVEREDNKGMFAIAGTNPMYRCMNCGYEGIVFPETEEEYIEVEEDADHNSK